MIKINLEVETPMTEDDRDILAGVSVMLLAIANRHNLNEQQLENEEVDEPMPCGSLDGKGGACVKDVAHAGRHKYRPLAYNPVN